MQPGNIHNICNIKEGPEYSSIKNSPYCLPNNTQYMQPKSWLNTYCLLPKDNILVSTDTVYHYRAPVDLKLPYCPPNFPQFDGVVDGREP